jgi:sugar lactone lactonase YvrE
MLDFKPLNDVRCQLGEGPAYDHRTDALYFCDIVQRTIHRVELKTGAKAQWTFPSEVGSLGVCESGRLVVALRHEVGIFDPKDGSYRKLAEIEAERGADTRLNDGKVGADGAFWVGTMDDVDRAAKEPIGSLYRVDASGKVERKITGLCVSNGLAFAPDGKTMFHSDSRRAWVDRWDFDAKTGAISNRRRLIDLDEATGRPDGGATDAEGCYWSAGVSAQRMNRIGPEGKILESHPIPVAGPTMPCFAGPGLRTMYVTSLRIGRSEALLAQYPLTGITLYAPSPVAGSPVTFFKDV